MGEVPMRGGGTGPGVDLNETYLLNRGFYHPSLATPGQPDPLQGFPNRLFAHQPKQGSHLAGEFSTAAEECKPRASIQPVDALPSQAAYGLTHPYRSSGFSSVSISDPHELPNDPGFSHHGFHDPGFFNNEFHDPQLLALPNPPELAKPSFINPFGCPSLQLSWPNGRSAMKVGHNFGCTSVTEDASAAVPAHAAPVTSHELSSGTATSQPLPPGHSAWEPPMQMNPLRTLTPNKRKAIALDDDRKGESQFRAGEIHYGGFQYLQDKKLACPFYKMNPKRYMRCGERSLSNISALGQHFSKAHKPKLLHCKGCFESFDDKVSEQRHKELGACVPTGGCSVDNLRGPRGKHEGPAKTWYCYWEQLFPKLAPPSSPHTDGLEVIDQCMLSAIQRVVLPLGLETFTETNLIHELFRELARWRQHSAEPLNHAQLRQYGRLLISTAGSWRAGPRQPTPIQVS